jgi:hypothetical protein
MRLHGCSLRFLGGLLTCLPACSGTADTPGSRSRSAPAGCEELDAALQGKWRFLDRGTGHDTAFRPNVSPHPDRLEFRSGEFVAEYAADQLEMLGRMTEDSSVRPVRYGRYGISGRMARDLFLIPCSIRMGPGFPEVRSVSVSGGLLELGNVGDTWSVERYRREE